jgi:hypothetical protein
MTIFGAEYTDKSAYFIAAGRTLDIIKKYEDDKKNAEALGNAIGREYGAIATSLVGKYFILEQENNNPALKLQEQYTGKDGKNKYSYEPNRETPEGKALLERMDYIPSLELGFNRFSKRLTGEEYVETNPDQLEDPEIFKAWGGSDIAAYYRKYGDTYVVAVPRVMHGIFNAASEKAMDENHWSNSDIRLAAGYKYEWFTPPDSQPIPYSKVIELREKELGDQTKPRQFLGQIVAATPRPNP